MARKGHRKSRNGCIECKRRHLKCDETRPRCNKCTGSDRRCLWPEDFEINTQSREASSTPQRPASTGTISKTQSYSRLTISVPPGASNIADAHSSNLGLINLELLHNFQTETYKTLVRDTSHAESFRNIAMSQALTTPYLMHGILAISALQLSIQRASEKATYRNAAVSLQSSALAEFLRVVSQVDATNALPVLLFQHITALHAFCDMFNTSSEHADIGLSEFFEHLTSWIRLLRVMDTTVQTWWDVLSSTEMGAIMAKSSAAQTTSDLPSKHECRELRTLIDSADLSPASIEMCQQALKRLQQHLDAENSLGDNPETTSSTNMIFAWLITMSTEFLNLLDQRRPEALVLMAYYAVLLHRRRDSWAVGKAGKSLLDNIARYLGKGWTTWLTWPSGVIYGVGNHPDIERMRVPTSRVIQLRCDGDA